MDVLYQQLMGGYILKEGDRLNKIHGYSRYFVKRDGLGWYLENSFCANYSLYRDLGLDYTGFHFYSPAALTEHVKALYETPAFKVGDEVKIADILKTGDCPFGFCYSMNEKRGRILTISKVAFIPKTSPSIFKQTEEVSFNGDFFAYEFEEDARKLNWHSKMFSLWKRADKNPVNTESPLHPYDHVEIGSYNMQVHESSSGWFLSDAGPLLTELGIFRNTEAVFRKHGINVTCAGGFPFVATSKDLQKACDLLRVLLVQKRGNKQEVNKTDEEKPATHKPLLMEDIITINNFHRINTDIIL